jgi:uncharacterized protein YrzB (UPF0473 family)
MKKISIFDYKGNPKKANLIIAFSSTETNKNYVVIDNEDLVFSENSSFNNLDVLEVVKEENNEYYLSNIPDSDWDAVQNTMIKEIFSKIKSNF